MAIDYKDYDFQIYEYLIKLRQELKGEKFLPEIGKWQNRVEEERDRIKTRRFRVAVVGEFKRGKTSFINALLGREILPADANPTTATINRITYGSVPKACLRYKDGREQEVGIENLSDYVTKLTEEAMGNAAQIEEAVVEYPSIFCQNYVDLIDTPGMNDDDVMNQVTVSQLEKIDLAIVAISANLPFSDTESSFMAQLVENSEICQIVVVITYIDLVRKRDRERLITYLTERIKEKVLDKLKETHDEGDPVFDKYETIFPKLEIFAVSSLDALEAREFNDDERFEESGFKRLNRRLPQLILNSQNSSSVMKSMKTIEQTASKYRSMLPILHTSITNQIKYMENKKADFAKLSYGMAETMMDEARVKMYGKVNDFCTVREKIKKDFILQLSKIRTLDVLTLENALVQQMDETQKYVNDRIKRELDPWLDQYYAEQTRYLLTDISRALQTLLRPEGEMFREVNDRLERLPDEKTIYLKDDNGVMFEWTYSPLPPRNQLLNSDIIMWIERAADQSMEDFNIRKKGKIAGRLEYTCGKAGDKLEEIVVILYNRANGRIRELQACADHLAGKELRLQLDQLLQDNDRLKVRFDEEIRGERRDTNGAW
ncbi:dynamin family protein [Clostridium sp. AM58-1XD]|uniref:dynamin family protein n=1 Tax=Clostridium sp. AM58-1XD TaxID=2292307 RepID=UPI000E4C3155|nr:dynamin family protein [Clostridium sp. AM58-1XD]RGY98899.1 hypothetical protein DXA13_09665 [Clostridium sp. AM58-1XD]